MTWFTVATVFALNAAAQEPACDDALQERVVARLPSDTGPWWLRCVNDESIELTRVAEDGLRRVRVVSLSAVSATLRVDLVVMAAKALLSAPAPRVEEKPSEPSAAEPAEGSAPTPRLRVPLRTDHVQIVAPEKEEAEPQSWVRSPWSGPRPSLGPFIETRGLFFVSQPGWQVSGAAGLEYRGLRVGLRAAGSSVVNDTIPFQQVALQATASLGLLCAATGPVTFCARIDFDGGVAFGSTIEKHWVDPVFDAHFALDTSGRAGPFVLGAAVMVGGGFGQQMLVVPATNWVGLSLGLGLHLAWAAN